MVITKLPLTQFWKQINIHALPKPEELFATLAGGITFTKLDLSQAYTQIPLDEESVRYVTINTHKGLYRYKGLPYGVASAPAIFQKFMDSTLQGIPNVTCYIDDILVTGSTHAEQSEGSFQKVEAKRT